MHCIISRITFKAFIQINVCQLETISFLDCENSDCSFRYGESGTDACGFIAIDVTPIIGGYITGKEEEGRREKESKQPILSAELLVYVVKMTRQTFF